MALSGQWPNTPEGPRDIYNWMIDRVGGMGVGAAGGVSGTTGFGDENSLLNQLLTRVADPEAKLDEEDRRRKAEANRAGPTRFSDIVLPTEVF